MKKLNIGLVIVLIVMIFSSCGNKIQKEEATLHISAAASLTDVLTEISEEYAKESNDELLFNFAGSGSLKKQIQEGAPCDLFISASENHMDDLEKEGYIQDNTRMNLLENTLTLIASKEKKDIVSIENLSKDKVKSIAIGTPESVPAGKYAEQSLKSLGILEVIQDKLIFGKDVRSVLDYVETGNVDCGFVYNTDALLLKSGLIISEVPNEYHNPIVYPMALLNETKNQEEITKFYDFLQTDYAKEIFEKYGFKAL